MRGLLNSGLGDASANLWSEAACAALQGGATQEAAIAAADSTVEAWELRFFEQMEVAERRELEAYVGNMSLHPSGREGPRPRFRAPR